MRVLAMPSFASASGSTRGELEISLVHTAIAGGASYFTDDKGLALVGEREAALVRLPEDTNHAKPLRAGRARRARAIGGRALAGGGRSARRRVRPRLALARPLTLVGHELTLGLVVLVDRVVQEVGHAARVHAREVLDLVAEAAVLAAR